jgi:hypothetical protein
MTTIPLNFGLIRASPIQINRVQMNNPPRLQIHLLSNAVGFSPHNIFIPMLLSQGRSKLVGADQKE